jgi:hypothetical protein
MFENKSSIRFILLLLLYFVSSAGPSLAQGICDVKSFRLDKVRGKVVSDGPKGYEPIIRAKVELWRIGGEDEDDVLVASTSSDERGLFEINNMKKGLYRLEVSKWESGFARYVAVVKVVKKVKGPESRKRLVFRLGAEVLKPCGGGDASLVREQQMPSRNAIIYNLAERRLGCRLRMHKNARLPAHKPSSSIKV